MVYGVEGSEKVIRPGRVTVLINRYLERKAHGEIKPEEQASGQITPSLSVLRPSVFDGLDLTKDTPAEIA